MPKFTIPAWVKSWAEWRSLMWNLLANYLPQWGSAVFSGLQTWYFRHLDVDWGTTFFLAVISFGIALYLVDRIKQFIAGMQTGNAAVVRLAPTVDWPAAPHPQQDSRGSEREQFQQSVIVFRAEVDERFLNVSDPYLGFTFWLFNGSLFPVYVKSISGHAKFTDHELAGVTELHGDQSTVPRGGKYRFTVRQWLSSEAVTRIRQMTNPETRSEFAFDTVYVTLAIRDNGSETVERRLDLPLLSNVRKKWEIRW